MSKFDETLSQTSYSRYAGCHSHSDLDKIRHDDIMQYGDMLATQEQECGGYEGVEGEEDGEVNYMTVHDGDNDEEGERANMLPIEESDEDEEGDEGGDECTPLGEDKEVLKLASSMNNIDEERFMKTHTMRLLLQKEKSKREEQFREGTIRAAAAYNSTKIPSSKYMPTHKTRVYKEWVDAQKDLRMVVPSPLIFHHYHCHHHCRNISTSLLTVRIHEGKSLLIGSTDHSLHQHPH